MIIRTGILYAFKGSSGTTTTNPNDTWKVGAADLNSNNITNFPRTKKELLFFRNGAIVPNADYSILYETGGNSMYRYILFNGAIGDNDNIAFLFLTRQV